MPIDMRYVPYCHPDSVFYSRITTSSSPRLDKLVSFPVGWGVSRDQPWTYVRPPNKTLPLQGWKVHVSATPTNCERVLSVAAEICFSQALAFKYLSTRADFASVHSKYSDRSSAGKFITIYPSTTVEFESALRALDGALKDEPGPYILSDRRWGAGPVYYRYGAFFPPADESKSGSTLIDPMGKLVEDERRPLFTPPEWVQKPPFLAEHDRENTGQEAFPFEIDMALHFSAGGGVYSGRALSSEYVEQGTRIVLKEARRYMAFDSSGRDAVDRLQHESSVLSDLQSVPYVPRHYGLIRVWEHWFLLMEQIEGSNLKRETMLRTPILRPAPWHLKDVKFLDWVDHAVGEMDTALRQIHSAGWVLGDIHPKNIIMRNGNDPIFIDFEFAHEAGDDRWRIDQVAPGYGPRPGLFSIDADNWSLGITQLDMLLPQAVLADQGNEGLIPRVAASARSRLGVKDSTLRAISAKLLAEQDPPLSQDDKAPPTDEVISRLVSGVTSQLSLTSDGPTFPGDIELFEENGAEAALSFPFGLTGALATLAQAKTPADESVRKNAESWIAQRIGSIRSNGFRGRDGIEYGLRLAGLNSLANSVAQLETTPAENPTYWSGWAGIGLNALSAGRLERAIDASDELEKLLSEGFETESAGLFHGWSGAALLWARLGLVNKQEAKWFDLASRAIAKELERCTVTKNRTLEVDEGWRTLPYLGTGSAGIALALYELRSSSAEDYYQAEFEQLVRAMTFYQCAQGIFGYGLSGFMAVLNYAKDQIGATATTALRESFKTLQLFLFPREDHLFIRGNQGLRLSCDFATGSLGVASTLSATRGDWSGIPFL